jgi:hypothetical protein
MSAKIYKDVRYVVMELKKEKGLQNNQILVDDKRGDGGGMYSNKLWANPKFEAMKIKFFNKEDLVLLYEFFSCLIERDSVIKERKSDWLLIATANDKLKKAAESAYKNISWEKYAGFKSMKFQVLAGHDSKLNVKFRMFFTVKDQKYALAQIFLIGLMVVILSSPALLFYSNFRYSIYVYSITALALFLLWKAIDEREIRRSEFEKSEMKIVPLRERLRKTKKMVSEARGEVSLQDIIAHDIRSEIEKLQKKLVILYRYIPFVYIRKARKGVG